MRIEFICKVCAKPFTAPVDSSNKHRVVRSCSRECSNLGSRIPNEQRFLKYVPTGDPNECWEWLGSQRASYGYGVFRTKRSGVLKVRGAHRISYEMAFGEIPPKMFVLHKCDNPPCVNPNHLFLGDQKANMSDCARKGRAKKHKLTDEQISFIRNESLSAHKIAKIFRVSRKVIGSIRKNKTLEYGQVAVELAESAR